MRVAWIACLVVGCGEPPLVMKPLPPLVAPEARTPSREIAVTDVGLAVGEHWIWDVQAHGFSIGRVELAVGDEQVTSHFHTGALASAVASVGYDLVTVIDRVSGRPQTSEEDVDYDGKLRHFSTQFAGTTAHSFQTALGAIRAWARPGAPPAFLQVVHADQLYRLELAQPIAQQELLRVDGHVIGHDVDLSLTIWLDAARTPVRIEVRDGNDRITAELIAG
jgi:hypothetical protein